MAYPQTIQYLESLVNYEKLSDYPYQEALKLERLKGFLASIGNPEQGMRCLHIAGTKGKGSTSAFLAYILKEAGYHSGLYTSPHLSDFRERIRVLRPDNKGNGRKKDDFEGMIPAKDLAGIADRLKPAIERYSRRSPYGPLSFFEVYTTVAFVYFREKKADFVVLETGLGGRLDATNVAEPLAAAITPLSYEHTQKLGRTLKEIAAEKAGIIKSLPNFSLISAPQDKEAEEVIRGVCRQAGVKLYQVGRDITYENTARGLSIRGLLGEYPGLKISLLGEHQRINAAVALGVIEALSFHGINVPKEAIARGLSRTLWPGRCELVSESPAVVLDGAQNLASVRALKQAVKENFKYKKLILVLGISSDKDIPGICAELNDFSDQVILTRANTPRATDPKILAGYFRNKKTYLSTSVKDAACCACRLADKQDLILVCGSLFVVGEYRDVKI